MMDQKGHNEEVDQMDEVHHRFQGRWMINDHKAIDEGQIGKV
jgi:hypothetical protein